MAAPPGKQVQLMFGEIAERYDFLNSFLSFGIDRYWRRAVIRASDCMPEQDVLDLCCGTGDLAIEFAHCAANTVGADFTYEMIARAPLKAANKGVSIDWLQADAQCLPFQDRSFDIVSIAFGIRNVENIEQAIQECRRVLKPNGRLLILEFFPIKNRIWRFLFRLYFLRVLPLIAAVVRAGRTGAYTYLPTSVDEFYSAAAFSKLLVANGFELHHDKSLTGGVARLFVANKSLNE
ncbi:MAG: bifunctional demethylmenaquinone methyltransferase/2-methoxy-6-polyprenyl-1,4-benzoquinol methylase UbiE [Planctomycetes bacterium]|nr:bifunctional demethylmenaquinone methyltransferase/2-methoxy-6-polyprenyl-1,4-benzoquinol methylase UbiE [Planctomycetota bacterium]